MIKLFFLYLLFSIYIWIYGKILGMSKFVWYDLWIGIFIDKKKRIICYCPLPCFLITIKY